MSERYNVQASDVLGENYKITSVECSDYNPRIDSTITVTISVNDVYGDAMSGESVTVVASEGNFTQLNGSDITASDSVTGTTNSSGQFTLTYHCSIWGIINIMSGENSISLLVDGWRYVQGTSTSTWALRRNQDTAQLILKAYTRGASITSTDWNDFGGGITYASNFKAPTYKLGLNSEGTMYMRANSDGSFSLRAVSGSISGSTQLYGVLEWTF